MDYHHIIVPLDGSEIAEAVLPHLELFINSQKVNNIELVQVVPPIEFHYRIFVPLSIDEEKKINEDAVRAAEKYLNEVKSRIEAGKNIITVKVLQGSVSHALTEYINNSGADLLIMSTHGRSGPSLLYWGSIAEKLLRSVSIPVFIVHPPAYIPK